MKSVLSSIIKKAIPVLKKYGVKRAGIFGSYARGEQKKGSDVDLLVEIKNKKMSLLGFSHLINELSEALNQKVDLVEYNALNPLIKKDILKEEIKIL